MIRGAGRFVGVAEAESSEAIQQIDLMRKSTDPNVREFVSIMTGLDAQPEFVVRTYEVLKKHFLDGKVL